MRASLFVCAQRVRPVLQDYFSGLDWARLVEIAAALVNEEAAFSLAGVDSADFAAFLLAEPSTRSEAHTFSGSLGTMAANRRKLRQFELGRGERQRLRR
jgi:hypothetical protein